MNKPIADRVLTVTRVQGEQIQHKNELKEITNKLDALNNALEQTQDEATLNETLEAREEFYSKCHN